MLTFILSLLSAGSADFIPGPSEYYIEPTDNCVDVRPGNEPLACDISESLNAALLKCDENPPLIGDRVGCVFRLPVGSFWIENTVHLYRSHAIVGPECGSSRPGSCLIVTSATTAFHFASPEQGQLVGRGLGSEGAKLLRMRIRRYRFQVSEDSSAVVVEGARAHIEDVSAEGFVVGFKVTAGINRSPATNANMAQLIRLRAVNNQHTGLLLDGGDSNAGLVVSYDGTANCLQASNWAEKYGPCANLVESSFLGNTVLSSHTAVCRDQNTDQVCSGHLAIGPSQRPLFLGPYSESDQTADQLDANGTSIGGLSFWKGGLRIQGPRLNALHVVNDRDPSNVADIRAGYLAAPGSAIEYRSSAISMAWPLAWKAYPGDQQWSLTLANLGALRIVNIEGSRDGPTGILGNLWLRPPNECLRFGQLGTELCPKQLLYDVLVDLGY